jgi:hypothetical protein
MRECAMLYFDQGIKSRNFVGGDSVQLCSKSGLNTYISGRALRIDIEATGPEIGKAITRIAQGCGNKGGELLLL